MDTFDLELAFYTHLVGYVDARFNTAMPAEIVAPEDFLPDKFFRRGHVMSNVPNTLGFGNGVYTRSEGIYQIDLWVPTETDAALEQLKKTSDAHLTHFFPANARGVTLTEGTTSAHIVRRPHQRYLGREGSHLREIIEVDYYVEIASGV